MRAALREACQLRSATAEEIDAYLQSFDGAVHLFWIMARDDCPVLDSLATAKATLSEFSNGRLLELQGVWGRLRAVGLALSNTKSRWPWLLLVAAVAILTGGILDVALESRVSGHRRLEANDLDLSYEPPRQSGFMRGEETNPV